MEMMYDSSGNSYSYYVIRTKEKPCYSRSLAHLFQHPVSHGGQRVPLVDQQQAQRTRPSPNIASSHRLHFKNRFHCAVKSENNQ